MCLPHCPTYGLTLNEAESPRGRIALVQALAARRLEPDPSLTRHLDRCLSCRACERMCPSEVPYGRLIADARRLIQEQRPRNRPFTERLLVGALTRSPGPRSLLRHAARFYQRSGLRYLAGRLPLAANGISRLDGLLPPMPPAHALPRYAPATGAERGRVALFTGCTGALLDQELLEATVRLLNRCGYGVHIPRAQGCCGALHHQQGEAEGFAALARRNLQAFAELEVEAVVFVASGCGAMLAEYAEWLETPGAEAFSAQIREVSAFLADLQWPGDLRFAPLPETVAVHDPCSLRNVLRQSEAPYRLLSRIPQIRLHPLPQNDRCCGAAGAYVLEEPTTADALREPKIRALATSGARRLVSANIGCALHLADGARRAGLEVEVTHPVVLLARQIRDTRDELPEET